MAPNESASRKSRLTAFLLAFLLGGFSAHRFHVGKNGSPVAMIVLTCTVVGIIVTTPWALIDWIMILCGTFKDEYGYKIKNW